jgi:hypothetical protein
MIKPITRLLTCNLTKIPLFHITFNYQKFKKHGKKNSCMCTVHPILADDEYVRETLNGLCDYIRDNYDMRDII